MKLLLQKLKINENLIIEPPTKKGSYRIPRELIDYLQEVQLQKKLNNESEALVFCLKEHQENSNLMSVRDEIEAMIETILANTYEHSMKKLSFEASVLEDVIDVVQQEYGIDTKEIKNDLKEKRYKENHAKAY